MTLVRRVARPMLAAIFVVQGLEQLRHPSALNAKVAPFAEQLAPLGLPNDPELLVRANGADDGGRRSAPRHRPRAAPRLAGPRGRAGADHLCGAPVLGRDRPGASSAPSGSASSRTSASSAVCCWPASTPRASPGWPTAPGWRATPRSAPPGGPGARQARHARRPPRGQAGRDPGARCPHLIHRTPGPLPSPPARPLLPRPRRRRLGHAARATARSTPRSPCPAASP